MPDMRTARERQMKTIEKTQRIRERQQEEAQGYRRSPGFDPQPKQHRKFVPEADRVAPLGLSAGTLSTEEQERKRREKAAAGKVFTNADL